MSDTVDIALPANAPAFLSRLRPARFTSPGGVESSFLFDDLTRTRDKKSSSHEIADSDITILQDLGSSLHVFSMNVYFVGDSCDIDADRFFDSLFERYTPDAPGILNHPRWGDRTVLPFGSPAQSESFVTGGGISRITVEFRETSSTAGASNTDGVSSSAVSANVAAANASALDRAKAIATTGAKAYSKFRGVVRDKVNRIKAMANSVVDLVGDARNEIEEIHEDILDALAIAATPAIVLAQVSSMIETIVSIPQDTTDLANAIYDMTVDVIGSFGKDVENSSIPEDVQNVGATYQSIGSSCLSGLATALINVSFTTRDQVGASIDLLTAATDAYNATMSAAADRIEGNILKSFNPDHDLDQMMHGIVRDTVALLLSRAFSLKSARAYSLDHPTDPLTETWTRYGDMDMLEFFCKTNKIVGDEFIEIPARRALVQYV